MDPATLQALRRNDPDQRRVDIILENYTNERLGEVVAVTQQNTVADEFRIQLGGVNSENFEIEPLIGLLQNRHVLKEVSLVQGLRDPNGAERMAEFDNRILRRILQAVARRQSSIHSLALLDFPHVPIEEMVSIIGGRYADGNGLQELRLSECGFRPTPGYDLEQLEASFRENTSLKVMDLGVSTTPWLVPVRSMLGASSSVEKLKLWCRDGDANAHSEAVGELLEATSTEEVTFFGFFVGAEIPRSIAVNEEIECLKFTCCEFSEDSAEQFRSIFIAKSHIKKLSLVGSVVPDFPTLALSVLRSDSTVRDFRIYKYQFSNLFSQRRFEEMLQLLENDSRLQKLDIGRIDTAEVVMALAASIPKIKLQEFHFDLSVSLFHLKPVLMAAFKRNTTLLNIVHDGYGAFFNEEDVAVLRSYAARNRFLQKWLSDSGSVPLNVVPVASRACEHSEDYTALFQSLRNNVDDIVQAFRRSPAGRIAELEDQVAQQRSVIQRQREQIIELQQQNGTPKEQVDECTGQVVSFREEGNDEDEDRQSANKRRRL